jgi:uncharacterized damage-inducible protein DinB
MPGRRTWRDIFGVMDDGFVDETTALLERTPRVVRSLLDGLSDSWLESADKAGGWTPRDVVGHLISAERDNWIPRIETILRDGTRRPFEPFDRFAHVERDRGVALAALIERFDQLRGERLARLAALVRDEDLERRGLHPEFGEVTLRQLISTWAVHDLDHVAQIYAALAGSRDAAVGPWKANLGILLRRDAG